MRQIGGHPAHPEAEPVVDSVAVEVLLEVGVNRQTVRQQPDAGSGRHFVQEWGVPIAQAALETCGDL